MLLYFTEFVAAALILAFMATQVIIPIYNGTVMFPYFRSSAEALERRKAAALDELSAAELEAEIEKLKELAEQKRNKQENPNVAS